MFFLGNQYVCLWCFHMLNLFGRNCHKILNLIFIFTINCLNDLVTLYLDSQSVDALQTINRLSVHFSTACLQTVNT